MSDPFAEQVVDAIVKDLQGRKGLDDLWASLDNDLREEVRQAWINLVPEATLPRLYPFIRMGSLLVIAEAQGTLQALVYRDIGNEQVEQVPHHIEYAWGGKGRGDDGYLSKLQVKIDVAPGEIPEAEDE